VTTTCTRRHRPSGRIALGLAGAALLLGGCGGAATTSYIHPNVDFSHMKRAAVLPFQNLAQDRLAGERMQSIFLMELLDEDILVLVDPRETVAAMQKLGIASGFALTPEQAVALGDRLDVDALFFGSVEEYGYAQDDRRRGPAVTAVFGLTETETGALAWRVQVHATGGSIWKRLFGGGTADLYEVSRKTVRKALGTLL